MSAPGHAVAVIWAYRRTGKFAFHVLTGALESDAELTDVPITFALGPQALVTAIRSALAADQRVLVGWSFYSPDFLRLAAELKTVRAELDDPRVVHVAGGVHASAEPEQTLAAGFDLVAIGEGETTVRELVRSLRNGLPLWALAGIASRTASGVRKNHKPVKLPLDTFPPFAVKHRRLGPIEITRGCIYACRFCQTPFFAGAAFRHRSIENIRAWLRVLVASGFRDYRFLSPTSLSYGSTDATPNLAAVEAMLAMAREEVGPSGKLYFGTFPSEVRPEHVTAESLTILKRYVDNRTLILGGQSGSDRVLTKATRGHDVAAIERGVAIAVEAGFVPHVDFLFGLPGEEPDDVTATLEVMDRLVDRGARVHGHTFMPLPGTPFRKKAPGKLGPKLRLRLEQLASRGVAYGQWETQEVLAEELAQSSKPAR